MINTNLVTSCLICILSTKWFIQQSPPDTFLSTTLAMSPTPLKPFSSSQLLRNKTWTPSLSPPLSTVLFLTVPLPLFIVRRGWRALRVRSELCVWTGWSWGCAATVLILELPWTFLYSPQIPSDTDRLNGSREDRNSRRAAKPAARNQMRNPGTTIKKPICAGKIQDGEWSPFPRDFW